MAYHAAFDTSSAESGCGLPFAPVLQTARNASTEHPPDIVGEALYLFRANVLFKSFEVKGSGDKLLLYAMLYISSCLLRACLSFRGLPDGYRAPVRGGLTTLVLVQGFRICRPVPRSLQLRLCLKKQCLPSPFLETRNLCSEG